MPGAVNRSSSMMSTISPWNLSRSTTPQAGTTGPGVTGDGTVPLQQTPGRDHTITHTRRLSPRRYPKDCPNLKTRWFYAVDIPKSNPSFWGKDSSSAKPKGSPKKFVPFSSRDSQSIEAAFQELSDKGAAATLISDHAVEENTHHTVKVPVNEDYLFDVDIQRRELAPVYWLGPIYEVRRGTWFFQEGSSLRPCDENLATQLEEGYLKLMPWKIQRNQQSDNQPRNVSPAPMSSTQPESTRPRRVSASVKPEAQSDINKFISGTEKYRLFGAYMNSTVTYQDSYTAWIMYDDFMSRMSSTVYQRLGGVAGTKVVRGYADSTKPKTPSDGKDAQDASLNRAEANEVNPRIEGDGSVDIKGNSAPADTTPHEDPIETRRKSQEIAEKQHKSPLERQISSLTGEPQNDDDLEEEARKQEEKEMEDSRELDGEAGDREIDHLVLITHGIGQRLGLRLDSINFVHDVNVLRKSLKSVYGASPDLQALNLDVLGETNNCRVQVLPV